MFEIKVKIEVPGLMELAHAITGSKQPAAVSQAVAPTQPSGLPAAPVTVPSVSQSVPAVAPVAASPTTVSTAAPVVPTVAQSYTLDDLARAAMTLMDAGRLNELQQLLTQFGVDSLPALPKEQYGAFATALRGLGAQI